MNNKELFKKFYDELYKNILDEHYETLKGAIALNERKRILTTLFLTVVPTVVLWFNYNWIFLPLLIVITVVYNIIIILFLKLLNKNTNNQLLDRIKYLILDDMITLITSNDESKVIPNNRISFQSIKKTKLFNFDKLLYNGSNFIETEFNHKKTIIADVNLYSLVDKTKEQYFYFGNRKFLRTYHVKEKKDFFNGCYISSELNRNYHANIQIIPHRMKTFINDKINNYYQLYDNKVALENPSFTKKYNVYTDDEIKCRLILTLPMMEKLTEIDNLIKGIKYIIYREDGRYIIYLQNITIEQILNDNLSMNRNNEFEHLYKIYEDLSSLYQMINHINNE